MFSAFAHGKWILAGEHAVLRGSPALVFPIKSRGMKLEYTESVEPLQLELVGEHGDELKLLAWGVIENAVQRLGQKPTNLTGHLRISSNLPIGAGLGASAALCAVISRWCQHLGWLEEKEIYEFSRSLEDLFHGESSGVDVAVALSGQGLHFIRGGQRTQLKPAWQPHFYLSFSGKRGVTSECVAKVKQLMIQDSALATRLDQRMRAAVELAAMALGHAQENIHFDKVQGFGQMVEALDMAHSCFEEWGLIDENLRQHLHILRHSGAAAVKPTGSGGGGYVLSLWHTPVPDSLKDRLIAAF
ncbi:MAG: mevalonate kinase [Bdellovibrionales bacterium]